jgi:hypothetical protein
MASKRSKKAPQDPMAALGLPDRYTDEGIERRNAELEEQGRLADGPTVKIVRDEFDMALAARNDAADGKLEPWSAPDPLKEANARVPNPKMKRRLLSPRTVARRGMRGWEPVKDSRGDLVKVGDMFLGEMPIEKARQRNAHYQEIGNAQVRDAQASHQTAVERVQKDAAKLGLGVVPLRDNEVVSDAQIAGLTGKKASQATAIGYEVRRGN